MTSSTVNCTRNNNLNLFNNIPQELKDLKQWVCFEVKPDQSGKLGKLPKNPHTGENASSNKQETWGNFNDALVGCKKYNFSNIGFAFSEHDPYCGIDIDQCKSEEGLSEIAQKVLASFSGTYSEYSTSGNGIHIITKGIIPKNGRKNSKLGLEIYRNNRFFVWTGNIIDSTPQPILNQQEQLNDFYKAYFKQSEPHYFKQSEPQRSISLSASLTMSDNKIIQIIRKAKNSDKFSALYDTGDLSGHNDDHSSADQALCNLLAFYTQDPDQIDRIFHSSGLYRDKWNRQDYKDQTIKKALNSTTDTYKPKIKKDYQTKNKEKIKVSEDKETTSFVSENNYHKIQEQQFPIEVLPEVLKKVVHSISTACKSPCEISGTAAQALAAIALGKKITVIEKKTSKLEHYLAFFHAVIGASAAARKSSNTGPLVEPFNAHHEEKKTEYKKSMCAYSEAKKQVKKLKDEMFTGVDENNLKDRSYKAAELDIKTEALKPNFYRLFATDVTGAAFIKRLNETEGCYSIFTTDGGDIIDYIIGNNQTGTNDMVFVKLLTKDHIHVDRVGTNREGVEIDVPDPCGNIFIMTQEERWGRFVNHPRLLGSGLIGRNSPVILPPLEIGYLEEEKENENITIDEESQKLWNSLVNIFLILDKRIQLTLSKEASEKRRLLNNEWQNTVGINQENYDVADVVHRFVSECVKRSALFHVCDHWNNLGQIPLEIPTTTFLRAVAVQKYYIQQAINDRRGSLGKVEARELEKFVEKWIEKTTTDNDFSKYLPKRTLQQYLHVKKDRVKTFLKELEECSIIDAQQLEGKRAPYYKLNLKMAKKYLAECSKRM